VNVLSTQPRGTARLASVAQTEEWARGFVVGVKQQLRGRKAALLAPLLRGKGRNGCIAVGLRGEFDAWGMRDRPSSSGSIHGAEPITLPMLDRQPDTARCAEYEIGPLKGLC